MLVVAPALAQPVAILADGPGPWQDSNWTFAAAQFSQILSDAGYSIKTVAPPDVPSAIGSPDELLAVPSLERLPFDTCTAIAKFLASGGALMATGGQPFQDPLYLGPNGQWLDAAAYQKAVGSPPPQGPFTPPIVETLSPWYKQFVNSAGQRVPIARGRGLSATVDPDGRYRVIGDLLAPSATLYITNPGALVIWLPWPQLYDPQRGQLVSALQAASNRLYLLNAGPAQIVNLPGEHAMLGASIRNASSAGISAALKWSVSSASGVAFQSFSALTLAAGELRTLPQLDAGALPNGDYTVTARVTIGNQEVDRLDSTFRIFDPTQTRQPDQKIHAENGSFYVGSQRMFLTGVNYWPRNVGGLEPARFNQNYLEPQNYDPDLVEADLAEIASLNFNLINIAYGISGFETNLQTRARPLIDFLERCRNHHVWVRITVPSTIGNGAYSANMYTGIDSVIEAALLPGNDRVFGYELFWEPFIGSHNQGGDGCFYLIQNGITPECNMGRIVLDPDWRAWVNDQYGSLANAQQIWGISAPVDANGQLTNPSDDQMSNDGPWRIMVAAYHRFAEDYLGRNIGQIAREIRRIDPDTMLSYRNWVTMTAGHNSQAGYDIGTGAAHLDFSSPENYDGSPTWPDDRKWGLVAAYSRYRTGGKPVQWTEFGASVGSVVPTAAGLAAETALCDAMMRQVNDDGSSGATVWWWPGGLRNGATTYGSGADNDLGIIEPDGTPRGCARVMSQWAATFAATPPDQGSDSPVTLMVDRDADARGEYGLSLNFQPAYVQARQNGQPVILADQGAGTDTSTMPLLQVGNPTYSGVGPIKFANAEFAGIRIVCPALDVIVENNAQLQIPAGANCQMTPTLVNTAEAQWLPASSSKGGVLLHTSVGDSPLPAALPWLQRTAMGPIPFTMGQSVLNVTGRMRIQGTGDFGEVLRLALSVDTTVTGSCAISLSSTASISAPATGSKGTISITTGSACKWTASSPQPWINVSPVSGTGSGSVSYTMLSNNGPPRQTTITIASHPFTVSQAAAAALSTVPAPKLSSTTLTFGSVNLGSVGTTRTVTLTNTGGTPLNLSSIAIGGPNESDFLETTTCGPSIATGANCTITISFAPAGTGARSAVLYIAGNISSGPVAIALTGTGIGNGPTPIIQSVQDVWNYTAGLAPGLWVLISGSGFATGPPQTFTYSGTDQLPMSSGRTSVTFNGTPGALLYVSATAIAALVPADIAPGTVQVIVLNNGVPSAQFTIAATAAWPAIYALPNSDGSSFFVTGAIAGTGYLIGNSAVDSRVIGAAKPGQSLDLYVIGLGATSDLSKFITSQNFAGAYPIPVPPMVTVAGENASVVFAGLVSPGLYLVRLTLPSDLQPGPAGIQMSIAGSQTSPALKLMMSAAGPNLMPNGSFEQSFSGNWRLSVDAASGAAATVEQTSATSVDGNNSAHVAVTSAATTTTPNNAALYSTVQFFDPGVSLQQGHTYVLQFWAKASAGRTMRFSMTQNGGTFQNRGLKDSATLGGDWQQYTFYFQATATDPAARLNLYFGDQAGDTWLDTIVLQDLSQ